MNDQKIKLLLTAFILLQLAVLLGGVWMHELATYCARLNTVVTVLALIVCAYELFNSLHKIELREKIFAVVVIVFTVLSITAVSLPISPWIAIVQYIIFGIDLLLSVLFLIFITTFKIKRLF